MPVALLRGCDPSMPCAASAFALLEMSFPTAQTVLGVCCLHSSVAPWEQNDVPEAAEMPLGIRDQTLLLCMWCGGGAGSSPGSPNFLVDLCVFDTLRPRYRKSAAHSPRGLLLTPAGFAFPAAPSPAREYVFQHLPFLCTVLQPDTGSGLGKLPVSRGRPSFCSDQSPQQAGLWHVVLASVLEFKGCCEGGPLFFPFMLASVQLKTQTAVLQE